MRGFTILLCPDNGEAEYTVEEDDSYYIGVVNLYHQSIVVEMKLDLSSKIYDTTRAKSQCSTAEGCCMLKLPFPNTQYVVLATPNDVTFLSFLIFLFPPFSNISFW